MTTNNAINVGTTASTVVAGTGTALTNLAYTASNTPSTIASRDVNGNSAFVNVITTVTSTVSSGQTINMTGGSAGNQKVTGSSTVKFVLPDATTMYSGQTYRFNNNSTASITVYLKDGTTLLATATAGAFLTVINTDNSTTNGAWDYDWEMPSSAVYGTAGLTVTGGINASTHMYVGSASPSNPVNLNVEASTSGGIVEAQIANSSNTASSDALLGIVVAGTSAGDAFVTYNVAGTTSWSHGIDNSVAGDPFVLSASNTLGTSNVLSATTDGIISAPNAVRAGGGTYSVPTGSNAIPLQAVATATAASVTVNIINQDNTSTSSNTALILATGGTSAGDAYVYIDNGTTQWVAGESHTDSSYVIGYGGNPPSTSTQAVNISNTGLVTMSSLKLGSGSTLSTYQEGTWTPALQFGGASTGITYATQLARYIRIGKIVQVWVTIELTNKGSDTGAATVTGLPYTVQNSITTFSPIITGNITLTATYTMSGVQPTNNGTTFGIIQASNVTSAVAGVSDTAFSNSSTIYAAFSYEALT